jgi:aspartokinase
LKQVSFERVLGVTEVQVTQGVAHIVLNLRAGDRPTEEIRSVFRRLADTRIPIFLIQIHPRAVSFAVEAAQVASVKQSLAGSDLDCSSRSDLAIVSVIASSMRDLAGVLVEISAALNAARARIYAIGDSHNSVQCLIDGEHVAAAVKLLNARFGLEDENA